MTFHDHFSGVSREYAAFRPRYPAALFAALAERAPARRAAWDCATGNGQAAVGLAEHFDAVVATDASERQIAAATPHPRVTYRVAPAERSGLADRSVDLVTVAQAVHWFDMPAFFEEVRRVLVPGGLAVVWCYELMMIDPAVDAIVDRFYRGTVGPYWPPERKLIETGYASVQFPFREIDLPPLAIDAAFSLSELSGYIGTWSAVLRYREAHGSDPVTTVIEEIAKVWGSEERRRVRWPIAFRAGYA